MTRMGMRFSLAYPLSIGLALLAGAVTMGMVGQPDAPDPADGTPRPSAGGRTHRAPDPGRVSGKPAGAEPQSPASNPRAPFLASLPGPVLDSWPLARVGFHRSEIDRSQFPLMAMAYYYRTSIMSDASAKARVVGIARRGSRVPAKGRVRGRGCKGGRWYSVAGGGYVCTRKGFRVARNPARPDLHFVLPEKSRPLPYKYAEVINQQAPRLYRLPTAEEVEQIAAAEQGKGEWPEVVERQMKGVFFLAIHRAQQHLGETYLQTVYGRYVRARDVKNLPLSPMHGEKLGGARRLPVAFVFGDDSPLYRRRGKRLEKVGVAAKHARFTVARTFTHEGKGYVADRRGRIVAREHVRIATRLKRPSRIPASAKWIHVDLSEQTLVAYKGKQPLFATIVSSGKEGYEPPIGVFRIVQKHVTGTMNGSDPIEGWYEVEEVPWTMYYSRYYAVHGAYWHDGFGDVRSHGCTNLAPIDARWIFSRHRRGTRLLFTD